jgi:hypothetical protein
VKEGKRTRKAKSRSNQYILMGSRRILPPPANWRLSPLSDKFKRWLLYANHPMAPNLCFVASNKILKPPIPQVLAQYPVGLGSQILEAAWSASVRFPRSIRRFRCVAQVCFRIFPNNGHFVELPFFSLSILLSFSIGDFVLRIAC